jgi:peptidoglycan/LPS O-acetylase OafA/YrhL
MLLNNRILKFFGKISYGLYVWHWPLYLLLFEPLLVWMIREFHLSVKWAATGSASLALLAALILSLLSYRFFEQPFLQLKSKFL